MKLLMFLYWIAVMANVFSIWFSIVMFSGAISIAAILLSCGALLNLYCIYPHD